MKANIRDVSAVKAEDNKVYLTIGMIVKNEERFLGRCLESVQKLLKNTNGELIIIDTGSTDRTVEIAKQFTDKVYNYEWNNDFAAARNESLRRASGIWFMYIDADEIFENTDGIETFVLNHQSEKIAYAAYNIRNMLKRSGNSYMDAFLFRIHRVYPGMAFQHMVHESLPIRDGFYGYQINDALCIHYGYSDDLTKSQLRAKQNRNTTMLESCLKQEPNSTHYLIHYIREFRGGDVDLKRQLSYINHGFEVTQYDHVKVIFQSFRILAYLRCSHYLSARQELLKMIESREMVYNSDIDCCFKTAIAAYQQKDYETAKVAANRYRRAIEMIKENTFATGDASMNPQSCITEEHIVHMKCLYAYCRYQLDEVDDMKNITKLVDFNKVSLLTNQIPGIDFVIDYCRFERDYELATSVYTELFNRPNIAKVFVERLQNLMKDGYQRTLITQSFYRNFGDCESAFTLLFKAQKGECSYRDLLKFNREDYKGIIPDIIYLMIKEDAGYNEIIKVISSNSSIDHYCLLAGSRYEEISELLPRYLSDNKIPTDQAELRLYSALSYVAISISLLPIDELKRLFEGYCEANFIESERMFNPQMFSEENIDYIPGKYKFAQLMNEAQQHRNQDDNVNAVKKLREALKTQEEFYKNIEYILFDIMQEKDKKNDNISDEQREFMKLGKTLLAKAEEFIAIGKQQEAAMIINQLSVLMPNNPEVARLKNKLK